MKCGENMARVAMSCSGMAQSGITRPSRTERSGRPCRAGTVGRASVRILDRIDRNRISSILVVTSLIIVGMILQYFRSYPQIGNDDEVFKTTDALFTALNTKSPQQLDECERRLQDYRQAGTLTPAAATRLEKIIEGARMGEWEKSSRNLYDFILAQRKSK